MKAKTTVRPLIGQIVEIPEGFSVPVVWCDQYRRDIPCRVGIVVEELPTLVSVQFFGYPTPWDYSRREAGEFSLERPA